MISICMPYYNRQAYLDRALAAYREHYGEIEINICDDGSDPPVLAPGCRVIHLPGKKEALNPCVPINRAVSIALQDVIVLTNPEMVHTFPILDEMRRTLDDLGERAYVTASCKQGETWLAHSSIGGGESGRGPMPEGGQFHFCAMFHRSLWDKAGGFDEDYREGQAFDDNDWLWRLEDAGAIFAHRDDLIVQHFHTGTKWPAGGWHRNRDLLVAKWGHKWSEAA